MVGIIGDRDLAGDGQPVTMFGHPTTHADRAGGAGGGPRRRAHRRPLPAHRPRPLPRPRATSSRCRAPATGAPTRRCPDRAASRLASSATSATTPEQWWGAFQPFWPDLAARRCTVTRGGGELGKADMHLHTLYSDGTASVQAMLDHVESATDLDVIAITDHERIDGALRAREIHAAGRLLVRPRRRRGDHHPPRPRAGALHHRAHPGAAAAGRDAGAHPRPGRDRDRRAPDGAAHAVARHAVAALRAGCATRSRDTGSTRIELLNPSTAGRVAPRRRGSAQRRDPRPGRPSGTPTRTCSRASARRGPGSRATPPPTTARRSRTARPRPTGTYWSHLHNLDVYRRQLGAKVRHLRHTLRPTGEWR